MAVEPSIFGGGIGALYKVAFYILSVPLLYISLYLPTFSGDRSSMTYISAPPVRAQIFCSSRTLAEDSPYRGPGDPRITAYLVASDSPQACSLPRPCIAEHTDCITFDQGSESERAAGCHRFGAGHRGPPAAARDPLAPRATGEGADSAAERRLGGPSGAPADSGPTAAQGAAMGPCSGAPRKRWRLGCGVSRRSESPMACESPIAPIAAAPALFLRAPAGSARETHRTNSPC